MLHSFGNDLDVAVIGASGGIGAGFLQQLANSPSVGRVHAFARDPGRIASTKNLHTYQLDSTDEESVTRAARELNAAAPHLRVVIVATGLLHDSQTGLQPEKTYRHLNSEAMIQTYLINTVGPALVGKHFLPLLPKQGRACFAAISARVGSISDNALGGWHSYRASKAALNQVLRNFAIETARKAPDCFVVGLHPGTVDTNLSQPFQRGVAEGKLFTAEQSATYMLNVLDGLEEGDSGQLYAWDGQRIAF